MNKFFFVLGTVITIPIVIVLCILGIILQIVQFIAKFVFIKSIRLIRREFHRDYRVWILKPGRRTMFFHGKPIFLPYPKFLVIIPDSAIVDEIYLYCLKDDIVELKHDTKINSCFLGNILKYRTGGINVHVLCTGNKLFFQDSDKNKLKEKINSFILNSSWDTKHFFIARTHDNNVQIIPLDRIHEFESRQIDTTEIKTVEWFFAPYFADWKQVKMSIEMRKNKRLNFNFES